MNNVDYNNKIIQKYANPMNPQNYEMFPGSGIPADVFRFEIFPYLESTDDFVKCAQVCQLWKQKLDEWYSQNEEKLPQIFGALKWEQYIGVPSKAPPLRLSIFRDYDPKKHLLTLIPQTVNGEPLTLKSIEKLVKKPHLGKATKYDDIWDNIKQQYGNNTAQKTHWLLLTKTVIVGTRNKTYAEQKEIVEKAGMKIPELLGTIVSVFMQNIRSDALVYTDAPWTYTRVQESVKIRGVSYQIVVGGFSASGLHVDDNDFDNDGSARRAPGSPLAFETLAFLKSLWPFGLSRNFK